MPKYHFLQGKIRVEDGVYSPILDQRPPDAGVILIIPPKGDLNNQAQKAMKQTGAITHDREEKQENS